MQKTCEICEKPFQGREDSLTCSLACRAAKWRRDNPGYQAERLDPLEKAKRNPKSLRLAVTAKCWDCIGGDADPNPKGRIGECEIPDCPLWPVRPWQKKPNLGDETSEEPNEEV